MKKIVVWFLKGLCFSLFIYLSESLEIKQKEGLLEFPSNESQYQILTNQSILESLGRSILNHTDIEVADLLKTLPYSSKEDTITTNSLSIVNNTSEENNTNPKLQADWIQNGENTEDVKIVTVIRDMYSPHGKATPMVQGHLAAILAGIFVVIAVVAYASLLSWRKYLENRYGNREILIDEEEMQEPTDYKYFSI